MIDEKIVNESTMFWTFLVVMGLGSMFFQCIGGYIEAIAMKVIKSCPSGATYGSQRVCGSIGACIITSLTGLPHFQRPFSRVIRLKKNL